MSHTFRHIEQAQYKRGEEPTRRLSVHIERGIKREATEARKRRERQMREEDAKAQLAEL